MNDDEKEERIKLVKHIMVERGVIKEIGPDKFQVISDDKALVASCYEWADNEYQRRRLN